MTPAQRRQAERNYQRIMNSIERVAKACGVDHERALLLLAAAERKRGVNATEELKVRVAIELGAPDRN